MSSYVITSFGAVGDGVTLNTRAINTAIAACAAAGGGTVTIPPGVFLSGTIYLRSHVNLHLEQGAVLKGSARLDDYDQAEGLNAREGTARAGLLRGVDLCDISITGPGVIDGSGTAFMTPGSVHIGADFDRSATRQKEAFLPVGGPVEDGPIGYVSRPAWPVWLIGCRDIRICDLRILDAPEWSFRLDSCEDIYIRGVTIRNNLLIPNSDGVHCTGCRRVRISDCDLLCGDDCIAISTYGSRGLSSEDIVVSNCLLQSRSAAVRIDSSRTPLRRVSLTNLVVRESNRGILIYLRGTGAIEDIAVSHVTMQLRLHDGHWWGKAEPIQVSAIPEQVEGSYCRGLRFSDIAARSESGIVIWGTERCPVEDIVLDQVSLVLSGGRHSAGYGGNFDLRAVPDPRLQIFAHDIPACYVQHARDIRVRGLEVSWGAELPDYFTYALECHATQRLTVEGFCGDPRPGSGLAAIRLVDVHEARLEGCRVRTPGTQLCEDKRLLCSRHTSGTVRSRSCKKDKG